MKADTPLFSPRHYARAPALPRHYAAAAHFRQPLRQMMTPLHAELSPDIDIFSHISHFRSIASQPHIRQLIYASSWCADTGAVSFAARR
jgi:hypothetical protein